MNEQRKRRFDLRRSPVDGMFRKWEVVRASACRDLTTGSPLVDPSDKTAWDYDLWVVTGVYRRRKDVFDEITQRARDRKSSLSSQRAA